jgi:hypothetical protein
MFGCVCYPKLSAQATNKFPPSTHCVFLEYSADHKYYRCLNLSTNIVVSRHVFGEAVFPIAASPRLTNDLGIFPWDDAPSVAPIPDPLPEACIPPGFPPLAAAGG